MSRLTELLRQARKADPQLGRDLEVEVAALLKRRTFGLVFERHQPEAVELPGRTVRRGDKVRVLPPRRGEPSGDQRVWRVEKIRDAAGSPVGHLVEHNVDNPATQVTPVDDLVVVAEFHETLYPGLVETGRIDRGGPTKPFHAVINAENYHALQMLTYTHRSKIDAIYIDPPYNSGASDWKYNNNYVAIDDNYRHSKWLAMMERRLSIARELLNPKDSVLIVTIDEKEYLRLGLLLEQLFPEARMQMIATQIAPQGNPRAQQFYRTDEYIFILSFGAAQPAPLPLSDSWRSGANVETIKNINWASLLRTGSARRRVDRPKMFYPFFVKDTVNGPIIHSIGEAHFDPDLSAVQAPEGTSVVWPIGRDGELRRWQVVPQSARKLLSEGFLRLGQWKAEKTAIQYLAETNRAGIRDGSIPVTGRRYDGSYIVDENHVSTFIPGSLWKVPSHDATRYGTQLISKLLGEKRFPYPKSLYAVEDVLRFYVNAKPNAIVLDFFAGSGTTAHAVMRLNGQDGGLRQSISVTNNEVSEEEQSALRADGLRLGDPGWEKYGICDYITKPRITAAISGLTPEGIAIDGSYKFSDEFPMADGFDENAIFFTLTYETPLSVRHHRAFERIAPILWMRAGSFGRVIHSLSDEGWGLSDRYGVLENMDRAGEFVTCVTKAENIETAFIITDDDSAFQMICRDLPDHVLPVRLYESYLQNFQLGGGR